MTREEQIEITSLAYGCVGSSIDFEAGAKWADANPKSPWISVDDDLPCNHEDMIALVDTLGKYKEWMSFDEGQNIIRWAQGSDLRTKSWKSTPQIKEGQGWKEK